MQRSEGWHLRAKRSCGGGDIKSPFTDCSLGHVMIENFKLRVFRVVADTRNCRRAADELHSIQPAVTAQIKSSEENLGMTRSWAPNSIRLPLLKPLNAFYEVQGSTCGCVMTGENYRSRPRRHYPPMRILRTESGNAGRVHCYIPDHRSSSLSTLSYRLTSVKIHQLSSTARLASRNNARSKHYDRWFHAS